MFTLITQYLPYYSAGALSTRWHLGCLVNRLIYLAHSSLCTVLYIFMLHFVNIQYVINLSLPFLLTEVVYDLLSKEWQLQTPSQQNSKAMSQKSGGVAGSPPSAALASGRILFAFSLQYFFSVHPLRGLVIPSLQQVQGMQQSIPAEKHTPAVQKPVRQAGCCCVIFTCRCKKSPVSVVYCPPACQPAFTCEILTRTFIFTSTNIVSGNQIRLLDHLVRGSSYLTFWWLKHKQRKAKLKIKF